MSQIYDNWERLVEATLLREHLRYLSRIDSIATSESSSSAPSFRRNIAPPSEKSLNRKDLGFKFTYQKLLQATANFSETNVIARGHSGDFFRGKLPDSTWGLIYPRGSKTVVVKRVDLRLVDEGLYLSELDFLSRVKHLGIVHLLGYCLEKEKEKLLVYTYVSHRDLSSSLYFKNHLDGLQSLDWITRMKIAIRTAEALCYLHEEFNPPRVHGDLQASSILLDDNFEVRLGSLSVAGVEDVDHLILDDDGITRATSEVRTLVTCAYDVYCFGKVLLELITGKLDISSPNNAITNDWLEAELLSYISVNDRTLVGKIVDPSLIIDADLFEELWIMAIVAKSCLDPNPERRPLMRYVLKALENPLEVITAAAFTESWVSVVLHMGA